VRDSCLDDVDTCDLYVLILGHRYGFQPVEGNPEKLSITHLEFRRAGQSGIPRIVLLRTSLPDTRLSDLEDSQRAPLVLAFRAEVQREVRPAQFSDLTGLIQGLSTGVQSELDKLRALSEHRTEAWLAAHLQDVAKQFESHMAASALKSGTRPEELYLDLVVAERHLGKKEEASPEELISALVSLWGSHTAVSKLVEGSREKRWYLGNLTPELAPQLKLGKLSEAVKAEIERLGVRENLRIDGGESDGDTSIWILVPSSGGSFGTLYQLRVSAARLEFYDCNVAVRAFKALAHIPGEASLTALQRAVEHDDLDVRRIAIGALAERGDQGLAARLLAQLRSATSPDFIDAALAALGVLRGREALSLIDDLLVITDGEWSDVHPVWGQRPGWGDAIHRTLVKLNADSDIQQALDKALASEDPVPKVAALKEFSRWFAGADLSPERNAIWRTPERLEQLLG